MRRSPVKHPFTTCFEFGDGDDSYELIVEGTMIEGDPGCTYGPPENCYPPEDNEFQVTTVYHYKNQVRTPSSWETLVTAYAAEFDCLETIAEDMLNERIYIDAADQISYDDWDGPDCINDLD